MNPLETQILKALKDKIRENNQVFIVKIPDLASALKVDEGDLRRTVNMLRKNGHISAKDSGRRGMTFWLPEHEQKTIVTNNDVEKGPNNTKFSDDDELNKLIFQIAELDEDEIQAIKLVLKAVIKNNKLKKMMF